MDLDRAALRLARIEYAGLDPEPSIRMLDRYAEEVGGHGVRDGLEFVAAMNLHLFQELGFRGNRDDYYDPRNSFLNDVISRRTGIPITLSVVYIEIARRLGRPVHGVGLPGHFIVRYDDGEYATFIDPFYGGNLLTPTQCFELARKATGADIPEEPLLLAPVSKRQIVTRMMANLRAIYFHRRCYRKALQLLDLLIQAHPDGAEDYRHRGLVHLKMRNTRAAKADFERYLELSPAAGDRADVERHLLGLRQYLARLN